MSAPAKEVIYVDIDDEITGIIEKVNASKAKIVALVLPKRASVLQSIVNMKLLKRTADEAKKRVVLITSEAGLLPLAGAVGVHVAKTLQSKPAVPPAPKLADSKPVAITSDTADEPAIDPSKPIGELAGEDEEETIEVDNDDKELAGVSAATAKAVKPDKKKAADRKLKIPNFSKFRLRMFLGGLGLLAVIILWYLAFYVWPKATVVIRTDSNTITTEIAFTADPDAEEVDEEERIVPASRQEREKVETERVQTTGEKDLGEKARGQVTLSMPCPSGAFVTVPAGTGVSTNNLTYITQEDITLDEPDFGSACRVKGSGGVLAQNGGERYNIPAGRTFSVAGYSSASGTNESAMTGGTSRIVKTVAQDDVDAGKQRIRDRMNEEGKAEIRQMLLDDGYVPIDETFSIGEPRFTNSPNVGDEATEVSVTATIRLTMTGVKEEHLRQLIEVDVADKIDTGRQMLLDDGLDEVVFRNVQTNNTGRTTGDMQVTIEAGPQLDEESIKQEIAGKKKGEAADLIKTRPGIEDAEISYSPFWVTSIPKNTEKIIVEFESINENDAGNEEE